MVTEAVAFVCTKHKTIKVLFTLFDSFKKNLNLGKGLLFTQNDGTTSGKKYVRMEHTEESNISNIPPELRNQFL